MDGPASASSGNSCPGIFHAWRANGPKRDLRDRFTPVEVSAAHFVRASRALAWAPRVIGGCAVRRAGVSWHRIPLGLPRSARRGFPPVAFSRTSSRGPEYSVSNFRMGNRGGSSRQFPRRGQRGSLRAGLALAHLGTSRHRRVRCVGGPRLLSVAERQRLTTRALQR